jgi:hypothetical protein
MRRALLLSLVLAGCRSSIAVTPGSTSCVTSFACSDGERCEEGQCVPDDACPGPLPPRLLYTASQANGDVDGAYQIVGGREYWAGPLTFQPAGTTAEWLVDLVTGIRSTFPHPPGNGACWGSPVRCGFLPVGGGGQVIYGSATLDEATETWLASDPFTVPTGWSTFAADQPAAGQWLVYDPGMLAVWTPSTGAITPFITTDTSHLIAGVVEAPGRPRTIISLDNVDQAATVSAAPLAAGASFSTLFTFEGALSFAVPVPAGDGGWFLVYNRGSLYDVLRTNAAGQTTVGSSDDAIVSAVAFRYRLGVPALDGTHGAAATCAGDTCRTAEVDLATVSISPIGSATLPGTANLVAAGTRWLACNTAEVVALEPIWSTPQPSGEAVAARLHLLRVLP